MPQFDCQLDARSFVAAAIASALNEGDHNDDNDGAADEETSGGAAAADDADDDEDDNKDDDEEVEVDDKEVDAAAAAAAVSAARDALILCASRFAHASAASGACSCNQFKHAANMDEEEEEENSELSTYGFALDEWSLSSVPTTLTKSSGWLASSSLAPSRLLVDLPSRRCASIISDKARRKSTVRFPFAFACSRCSVRGFGRPPPDSTPSASPSGPYSPSYSSAYS